MLADLNTVVRPALHIMDGIVAMEGNGPGSGDPRPMYAILASTDPVALDAVFCRLIYLDPQLVATNTACMEAGVGTWDEEHISVLLGGVPMQREGTVITEDELEIKYAQKDFNVQRGVDFRGELRMMRFFRGFIEKKPVVIASKCVGCGICEQTCPLEDKAITVLQSGNARIAAYDYTKCIKCYCCQEMCPKQAITIKKSLLSKVIDRRWKV
jgi:ferredoxin